jgi:spoIIIJ-associated protein
MAQRFEGRNLEEALTQAAETFGVERYQLTYHVLLEKRGFLGGMKRVVLEAEVNTSATAPQVAPPVESPVAARAAGSAPRSAPESRGRGQRDRGRDRNGNRSDSRGNEMRSEGRGGRRRGRGGPRDRNDVPREESVDFDVPVIDAPPQGDESEAASSVRAWCEQVFRLSKLSAEIRTEENDTQINVRVYGRDAGRLTERNGELLDAIQVLANKALTGRRVEKDIELDCAQFKEKRMEDLGERARETADRVRRDGREQLLPAMSPIERRIVHLALAEDADVTTESRGEGFYKRVAIIPRPANQQPEP